MRAIALCVLGGLMLAGEARAQGGAQDAASVGDPAAGKTLAGQCRTCHGIDGVARIPIAPNIGGETAGYLSAQLHAFKEGKRVHEMMSVVSAALTDQQIADLAAWYGSITPVAALTAAPEDAPELCTGCHAADGISVLPEAPHLAGEAGVYILEQLKAFASGKRESEVMTPIAQDLSPEEMRAAADWYAAVEFTTVMPDEGG